MLHEAAVQGSVLQLRGRLRCPQHPHKSGTRGKITEFSRASRLRLLKLTARLDTQQKRVTFVTLTHASSPLPSEAKRNLKRFLMRVRRRYPNASGIWREERQARGSIHYHIVWFNLPFWKQDDMQKVWTECTGESRSIVDVRLVKNSRMLMSYVSKYIAKKSDGASTPSLDEPTYQHAGDEESVGRQWGYINKDALPYAEICRIWIDNTDVAGYLGWYIQVQRGFEAIKWRYTSFLFTDKPLRALQFAWQLDGGSGTLETVPHTRELATIFR